MDIILIYFYDRLNGLRRLITLVVSNNFYIIHKNAGALNNNYDFLDKKQRFGNLIIYL